MRKARLCAYSTKILFLNRNIFSVKISVQFELANFFQYCGIRIRDSTFLGFYKCFLHLLRNKIIYNFVIFEKGPGSATTLIF
jgi:hypothetical protein